KLYQYGLNDGFGQNQGANNACPAQTTATGAQANTTTIEVGSTKFFYVGDQINITGVSPSGAKLVTDIPHSTHITVSSAVTVGANAAIQDCMGSFNNDANALWRAESGCTQTNCGQTIHLFVYAGYDETSVWQEFGPMLFQNKEDIPREPWGNPNPLLPNWT